MKPIQSFSELNLPGSLPKTLAHLNFIHPTPVQAAALPVAFAGHDILATADTGTGKTAAFGLPLLSLIYQQTRRQALILAPTRELAAQIHAVLTQLGKGLNMWGTLIVGGESFFRQTEELRRRPHFIVATPGRLNDHLSERTANLSYIDLFILDEVDRMLDMGFLPQIRNIIPYLKRERQTLMFSATLPDEIVHLASKHLKNPVRIKITPLQQEIPKVVESTLETTAQGKNSLLLTELSKREGKILIFARTQSRTERLHRFLIDHGLKVVLLHGGRSQGQRRSALERFTQGFDRIMVATDIAGRGIDVPDIEHVINFDVPGTRDDYIHRIGRTGRWGKTGKALNFVIPGDTTSVVTGVKPPSRVIYRSPRRRRFGR